MMLTTAAKSSFAFVGGTSRRKAPVDQCLFSGWLSSALPNAALFAPTVHGFAVSDTCGGQHLGTDADFYNHNVGMNDGPGPALLFTRNLEPDSLVFVERAAVLRPVLRT